jgi:hypothetical protein
MSLPDSQTALPSPLAPWWKRWPGRLEAELARFAALELPVELREDPRVDASRLVLATTVALHDGAQTPIVVVFPDGYPDRRFAVFAPELRLKRHQAYGGNLCVFPRDARYWRPHTLAADVVAHDVPELVRLVQAGGEELRAAEDPQGEPATDYYAYTATGGIVVDHRALDLPDDPSHGTFAVALEAATAGWIPRLGQTTSVQYHEQLTGQAWLASVRDASGRELLQGSVPGLTGRYTGPTFQGHWVRLPEPPFATTPEELWEAVALANVQIARTVNSKKPRQEVQLLAFLTNEEVAQDTYAPVWVFLLRGITFAKANRKRHSGRPGSLDGQVVVGPVHILRGLRWTEDDLAARIPELAPLRTKSVAVFGLGSLGAPLAGEFAKARIGEMALVDFDYMDPGTAVRHPLGLGHAGISKPLAVLRWLCNEYPGVRLRPIPLQVGAAGLDKPEMSELEVLGWALRDMHLMVSATAEDDVNRQLDRIATDVDLPRLYLWSVSGYGGVVALLRRAQTGCYHCLELFQEDQHKAGRSLVRVPPDAEGGHLRPVQGRGCGDRTFAANNADLLPLVAQAARVAFGLLSGTEGGYPASSGDVFAVQLREPDGTPVPPIWTTFDLPPDVRCDACNSR